MTGLVIKALIFSAVIFLLNIVCLEYLDLFRKERLANAIFLEAAILMVMGGITDFVLSLTMRNIRNVKSIHDFNAPPVEHKRSASASVLLLSGIFLCIYALFLSSSV